MPMLRSDETGDGGQQSWKAGFDEASSAGPTCLLSGAPVPHMPEMTARHRDWHVSLERGIHGG